MKVLKPFPFVILTLLILLFHGIFGHFYAPEGITYLPVTMLALTVITFRFTSLHIGLKCLALALSFLMLDFAVKLYAGGDHDLEGLDWMNLFYAVGFIISFPFAAYWIVQRSDGKRTVKILLLCFLVVFAFAQYLLFWDLGLGREYPVS